MWVMKFNHSVSKIALCQAELLRVNKFVDSKTSALNVLNKEMFSKTKQFDLHMFSNRTLCQIVTLRFFLETGIT